MFAAVLGPHRNDNEDNRGKLCKIVDNGGGHSSVRVNDKSLVSLNASYHRLDTRPHCSFSLIDNSEVISHINSTGSTSIFILLTNSINKIKMEFPTGDYFSLSHARSLYPLTPKNHGHCCQRLHLSNHLQEP
jgi:hypothetical protein